MDKTELKGYLEFSALLVDFKLKVELSDLLSAAEATQIHTFGWPIGLVMPTEEWKPKPFSQGGTGIRAIIRSGNERLDYWTLKANGEYYILKTLFEDQRTANSIFLDTRIVRTTELILRTARLYQKINVPLQTVLAMRIEYGGLKGRVLRVANSARFMPHERICSENVIAKTFHLPLENYLEIGTLKTIVFEVAKSITEMCEMFVPNKELFVDPIVESFVNGRIL